MHSAITLSAKITAAVAALLLTTTISCAGDILLGGSSNTQDSNNGDNSSDTNGGNDTSGSSGNGDETASGDDDIPPLPAPILTAVAGNALVNLSWDSVEGASNYRIHWATSSFANVAPSNYSSGNDYQSYQTTATSHTITNLHIFTPYYFVVIALNSDEESQPSDEQMAIPLLTMRLNDTGIMRGRDYPSGNNDDCTSNVNTPQDCHQGRDATANDNSDGHGGFSFTKLASDGTESDATADTWACVRDEATGLVWEVKNKVTGSIHHKDNTYAYNDWSTLVDGSNNETLCGFDDWRVPGREALRSIVHYGKEAVPAIDSSYFPHTTGSFWSASLAVGENGHMWAIAFDDLNFNSVASGYDLVTYYSNNNRVRLVRGDAYGDQWPDARYTVHDNGTVTDKATGLMWKQCAEGQSGNKCTEGSASEINNWKAALATVNTNNSSYYADYNDWRLPNIKELASLAALDRPYPSINTNVFPNTPSSKDLFLSSSTNNNGWVWYINFVYGSDNWVGMNGRDKDNEKLRVRLVRGGQ